eukprot:SAG25_NODE_1929_length_2138_cov_2.436979_2_plen_227_part_00
MVFFGHHSFCLQPPQPRSAHCLRTATSTNITFTYTRAIHNRLPPAASHAARSQPEQASRHQPHHPTAESHHHWRQLPRPPKPASPQRAQPRQPALAAQHPPPVLIADDRLSSVSTSRGATPAAPSPPSPHHRAHRVCGHTLATWVHTSRWTAPPPPPADPSPPPPVACRVQAHLMVEDEAQAQPCIPLQGLACQHVGCLRLVARSRPPQATLLCAWRTSAWRKIRV